MQAVILAGGQGTRIRSVKDDVPKSMLPIGGKPLLLRQIELLKSYGITEIIILVNYLKDSIISYLGNGEKWGVSIQYYEEETPLGTVGGVKAIENILRNDFILIYGDVMMDMDIARLKEFHISKKSECTIVVHPNDHPYDSDLVDMDSEGKIIGFHSKPHNEKNYYRNLVSAGVYIFSTSILNHLEKNKKADFGKDIFPKIFDKVKMFGYNTSEYLKDMGTPDRLAKVNHDFEKGKIQARSFRNKQKAIFLDRDGVINEDTDLVKTPEELKVYPYAGKAVKKINDSDYLSIVITNQSVIARNLCTEDGLRLIHNKLDSVLSSDHALLDSIYYCPHHPDKGFAGENEKYKIDCHCRKPKPGMLLDAARDYNIDLSESYFVGDAQRDIEAGVRAGVTTVGVMTGKGLFKSSIKPDYLFLNLEEAVDFIIDDPHQENFKQVKKMFLESKQRPYIILLGGNTRSGKSSLATYLKKEFAKMNVTMLRINLDNWLLPLSAREESNSVFEKFQLEKLASDFDRIMKKEKVELAGYVPHPSWENEKAAYQYVDEQIILVEGVVALADENLRSKAHLRIFKNIEAEKLKKRFTDFYRWKGKSEKEIDDLFNKRKTHEYDIIEQHKWFADIVI